MLPDFQSQRPLTADEGQGALFFVLAPCGPWAKLELSGDLRGRIDVSDDQIVELPAPASHGSALESAPDPFGDIDLRPQYIDFCGHAECEAVAGQLQVLLALAISIANHSQILIRQK